MNLALWFPYVRGSKCRYLFAGKYTVMRLESCGFVQVVRIIYSNLICVWKIGSMQPPFVFLCMHFSLCTCICTFFFHLILFRMIFLYRESGVCVCVCVCVCVRKKNVCARVQPPSHQIPPKLAAYLSSQYSFSVPHRLPQ